MFIRRRAGFFFFYFFSLRFFFFFVLGNKQTQKKNGRRKKQQHKRTRRQFWVTKLTQFECVLFEIKILYCKHICTNNFENRLRDDLNAPDFELHISTVAVKIVDKKKIEIHRWFVNWHFVHTHTHTPYLCRWQRLSQTYSLHSLTRCSSIKHFIFQLLIQISVDLLERMFWAWFQDHISFMIASRAHWNIKSHLICHV